MQAKAVYRRRTQPRTQARRRRQVKSYASGASPATLYTLAGPSGGLVGSASSDFTVQAVGVLSGDVVVTPDDGGKLGSFTPSSVTLTAGTNTSATFTYTPLYYGSIVISTTNDGALTDPDGSAFESTVPTGEGGGSVFSSSVIAAAQS